MTEQHSDCWLAPTALYGTMCETRSAWGRVAKTVVKTGRWQEALAELSWESLHDLPGEILIERASGGNRRDPDEPHWRLYWATEFIRLYKSADREVIDDDLRGHLILDGMRALWFTLPMLGCPAGDMPNDRQMKSPRLREHFYREVADAFLGWLPKIGSLGDRFGTESGGKEYHVLMLGRTWWAPQIVGFVANALGRDLASYEKVKELCQGDYVQWLISQDFIEETATGYRLKPD